MQPTNMTQMNPSITLDILKAISSIYTIHEESFHQPIK